MSVRRLYMTGRTRDTTGITVTEVLRRAVNRLAGGGPGQWAKGDFHVGGGACALGVINDVMAGYCVNIGDYNRAERMLLQELKNTHPELTAETIPELNDDPAVTFEDVLAAFEKTALQFEEKVV